MCTQMVRPSAQPNLVILASNDIVSLDQAALDMIGEANPYLKEHRAYRHMLSYAEATGLGRRAYNLVTLS